MYKHVYFSNYCFSFHIYFCIVYCTKYVQSERMLVMCLPSIHICLCDSHFSSRRDYSQNTFLHSKTRSQGSGCFFFFFYFFRILCHERDTAKDVRCLHRKTMEKQCKISLCEVKLHVCKLREFLINILLSVPVTQPSDSSTLP